MGSFSEILSHGNENNVLVPNLKITSYLLKKIYFQNIIKYQAMDFISNFMDFSFSVWIYDKSIKGVSSVRSLSVL